MLAARKDIGTVTVAELARAADIDRSTFYSHASSPTELLLDVLREDLDPLRVEADESLDGSPETVAQIGRGLNARLVDHVERYEAIYADRDGGRPSSALHTVLSGHVRTSLELVFRHLGAPTAEGDAQVGTEYLAAFVAHGVVGAVSVWLSEPAPRDRTRLEAVLGIVYSAWIVPAATRRTATEPPQNQKQNQKHTQKEEP
ncbi:TetR/AcrR family transcriptional regulator [Gryllotalpicola reticulitermitis]|uniref:TetR/AcrR family transcriptional regulator n=1 Tax=Gryllotalpicola reticulitermitis TaxID=1184153 RepID=A0ABV8Q8U9_9MICO